MNKQLARIFLGGVLFWGICTHAQFAHAATISGTDNLEAEVGESLAITDIEVVGASGTIPVKLLVTHGTLSMGTTTGLTFTGPSTGAELYFSGSVSDVNAALATLTYTRASTGTDELEISLVEPGEVFFPDNGHLYEYISVGGGITWGDAQTAAAALERYGAAGYLTTITSSAENDFAADRLEGAGWMGASDAGSEGVWRWVTGPETGTQFWSGNASGSAVGDAYTNWDTSEPNDAGGNEDCAQFLSGASTGEWNDLPCSGFTLTGYVVEFGAEGDMPDTAGTSFTITTYDLPEISTLFPLDNAVNVQTLTNLVLTFDAAVNVGTGYVHLYRSNGSLIESIDVTGGQVTGSGTTTITVNPTFLQKNSQYYVLIDATAFDAVAGGSYAGIASSSAWNFKTKSENAQESLGAVQITLEADALACNTSQGEVRVQVAAEGALRVLLADNASFLSSAWESVEEGVWEGVWVFEDSSESERLYILVEAEDGSRNESEHVVYFERLACEEEEGEEGESEDSEQDAEGDEEEAVTRLVRGTSFSTVYWVQEGKRKPFPSEAIFFTHFSDFESVEVLSDSALAALPMGTPVLPAVGSLVKIQSMAQVYVVEQDENVFTLRHIQHETSAREEFGETWTERVLDVDSTLFRYFAK